ncbi:hypothetical protein Tco_1293348 [Tanacetum coccineum]
MCFRLVPVWGVTDWYPEPSIPIIPVVPAEVPIAPVDPIVTPEVGAVSVISPTGVLNLVDYSFSSDSDPSEYSLLVAPELPLVSPFLCTDDSEAENESDVSSCSVPGQDVASLVSMVSITRSESVNS